MLLSEIVAGYIENPPVNLLVGEEYVTRCLKTAVRFYCGYQKLAAPVFDADLIHDPVDASNGVGGSQDFDITPSELAIIEPLFRLYVERENAMHLEASRGLGVDVFGRSVSEISQEITQRELDTPRYAFYMPAETV